MILLLAAVMVAAALPACSLLPEPPARLAEATPGAAESENEGKGESESNNECNNESKNSPKKTYEAVSLEVYEDEILLAPEKTLVPSLLQVVFKNDQDCALLAVNYDIYGRNYFYNNDNGIAEMSLLLHELPAISFVIESSNPETAVSKDNEIIAVSAGKTVLTVTLIYGELPANYFVFYDLQFFKTAIAADIQVTVAIPLRQIAPTADTIELEVGKTAGIGLLIDPADASGVALAYTSGDEGIATVNESGEITGVSAGQTTVTITATDTVFDKTLTTEIAVTVKDPPSYGGGGWSSGGSGGGGGSSGGGGGGGSSGGLTAAQYAEAYAIAAAIVARHAGESETQMLASIASEVNAYYNQCRYTTDRVNDPYYDTAYGVFVAKTASCAGATRAVNLCLSIAGYSYEHVNEWQYSHQWSRVYVVSLNQYWVVDGGITGGRGLAAPEPAPYRHPWLL